MSSEIDFQKFIRHVSSWLEQNTTCRLKSFKAVWQRCSFIHLWVSEARGHHMLPLIHTTLLSAVLEPSFNVMQTRGSEVVMFCYKSGKIWVLLTEDVKDWEVNHEDLNWLYNYMILFVSFLTFVQLYKGITLMSLP